MSLLEIMVVLILIGLVTGTVVTQVIDRLAKGKFQQTQNQIREMVKIVETFYLDCGTYPSSSEGFEALMTAPDDCPSWGGPYIKKKVKDGWGRELIYEFTSESDEPVIISLGADGREGGAKKYDKDIISSEL